MNQGVTRALGAERLSRAITLLVLALVAALAWWLLEASASTMRSMEGEGVLMRAAMAMMRPDHVAPYFVVSSAMWLLMMIAMMTPAVLPVLMTLQRMRTDVGNQATAWFALGYLAIWGAFGQVLTGVQWLLHEASHLHGMAMAANPVPAALILIGAGLYQLTPLKRACLAHCQSPLAFLLGHWRDGTRGAFVMGLDHGRYCLGCCWALMLVMFVGGVMSVATMAVL
ncbi:DUF2182 domain-containing protein, partial [Limnoraphis robusta]